MLIDRLNPVQWEWMVYLEMFVAGIAAGAYMVAAMLEWSGRGTSAVARAGHALAFPLVAIAALLLTFDLDRPERFWHMTVQSKTMLPMFKYWSPMSVGAQALVFFGGLTFVSFVDFLIGRGLFHLGGWRAERTLHGSALGRVWALLGLVLGTVMAAYSGVLLSSTNIPGWADSTLIGALFVATSIVTGTAALILLQTLRGLADEDLSALAQTNTWLIAWWLLLVVVFLASLGEGARFLLAGTALVALIGAILLGGVVPLALRFAARARAASMQPLSAALVLIGGFLLRYAIVVGPQNLR